MGGNSNHLKSEEQNKRFLDWCNLHARKIEKLGFQYGLAVNQSVEVSIDTFIAYKNAFESSGESEPNLIDLYKTAIQKIIEFKQPTYIEEDIFPFKEDEILHIKITHLDSENRIPLILSSFHGLKVEEIAGILKVPLSIVQKDLQSSKEMIGLDHLEQHLKLLNKSYERMPVLFNGEQLFSESSNEIPAKKTMSKKTVWSMIAIMALIIGAFTLLSFLPKTIEHAASDSVLDNIFSRYEDNRTHRQKILGLSDEKFSQIQFIREADSQIVEMKNTFKDPTIRREIELEIDKVIESIKLPSEMMDDVEKSALNFDEEKSIAFFTMYDAKVNDLLSVYNSVLWEYRSEIEEYDVNPPEHKADMLMVTTTSFSDELQNAMHQMRNQSIKLCTNEKTGEIESCYYFSQLHERMVQNLHYHLTAYFFMRVAPNSKNSVTQNNYPTENELLQIMEYSITNVLRDEVLYPRLETDFINKLYSLIKGDKTDSIYNDRKLVKQEYQEKWQMLYNYEEADVFNYLVKPIVEEMIASGWAGSNLWNEFTKEKIIDAIGLARDGKLEEIMYGKPPLVVDHLLTWPNESFLAEVEHLYHLFKIDYDKTIFKNVSPLYIVGVFDYANEMEDPETMFHLFHESAAYWFSETGEEFTLENYVSNWLKGFSLFEGATRIEFRGEQLYRMGHDYISSVNILYEDDFSPTLHGGGIAVGLVIDKEGVWYIREARYTRLPLYDTIPEVEIKNYFDHDTLGRYYYDFKYNNDPNELKWIPQIVIAGLYMYAAEQGDFETQYRLLFQDENHQIDKEQFLKEAKVPDWTIEDRFIAASFQGQEQDENGNWPGLATFTVNLENFPNEHPLKEFKMMWTKQGWRVQMNPME